MTAACRLRHLLAALALCCTAMVRGQGISYIETTPSWYVVYDQDGKRLRSFSTSQGRLVAYTSEFYIIQVGTSWYYTYDAQGKRIHSFSVAATGEILSASGSTFVSRHGSWIYTWAKDGRRVASRSATAQ